MSDQKQTASELLREFQDRYHSTGYVREPLLALDRLVAAVRAEALEEYRDALSDVIKAFDDSRDGRGWDSAAVDAVRALVSK